MTTIWHNPRCSKSRQTLALLRENGVEPEIRDYRSDAPTAAELHSVLEMLGLNASGLLRKSEALAKELGLSKASEDEVFAALLAHPALIERPIVIHGTQAVLGRPPENVHSLFSSSK